MEHVIGIQFLTKLEERIPCQGQPKSSMDHLLRRIQDGASWPVDLTGPLVNPSLVWIPTDLYWQRRINSHSRFRFTEAGKEARSRKHHRNLDWHHVFASSIKGYIFMTGAMRCHWGNHVLPPKRTQSD